MHTKSKWFSILQMKKNKNLTEPQNTKMKRNKNKKINKIEE